jgi:hypothetical protein
MANTTVRVPQALRAVLPQKNIEISRMFVVGGESVSYPSVGSV